MHNNRTELEWHEDQIRKLEEKAQKTDNLEELKEIEGSIHNHISQMLKPKARKSKSSCTHVYTNTTVKQDEVGNWCYFTSCTKCGKLISKEPYFTDEQKQAIGYMKR